jgi:hypothetical protein
MRAYTMLGDIERTRVELAGAQVEIAAPRGALTLSPEGTRRWVRTAAETVAQLYGRLPVDRLVLMLSPAGGGRRAPVTFGLANRGGGNSIAVFVNPDAADTAFLGEWQLIHEMLHFGMPFVSLEDAWFSEGFATYYGKVLRARAGLIGGRRRKGESLPDAQTRLALNQLAQGFRRALRSTLDSDTTLRDAVRRGEAGYTRLYWGGAAAWFRADIEIRKATMNEHSLDDLMREIWSESAPQGGIWTAEDLLQVMKRKTRTWSPEASEALEEGLESVLAAARHPDLGSCFADLAVEVENGELRFADEPGPEAATRAAIFSPDK